MHARIDGGDIKLLTRTGLNWSHRYHRTIEALAALKVKSAYLDGELCALNGDAVPVFSRLQAAMDEGRMDQTGLLFVHASASGRLDDLPAQSPPWPLRCCGSILGYCSFLGIGLVPGPRSLRSVNVAYSLGNPLAKGQVGFKFNFDEISIQQRGWNLDLDFAGVAADPCRPPTPTCPSSDEARG
jgi:hypothetical protein